MDGLRAVAAAALLVLAGCGGGDGGDDGGAAEQAGLDTRPVAADCTAPERLLQSESVGVERAFPTLSFVQPVGLVPGPGGDWFLLERAGRVQRFADDPAVASATLFADLSGRVDSEAHGEAGLLGLAFHPRFPQPPHVYLYYTADGDPLTSVLARFTVGEEGLLLPDSEQRLLTVAQPFGNHNGGQLAFGPDGYLYWALGDGGSGGDPLGNAQNPHTLLGSILRLDVDGGTPYAIPPGNPFADGQGGRPEVYAYGLRNPWRFSFDPATGRLWAGDVGQSEWEEIDHIVAGGNYGWAVREGSGCFRAQECRSEALIPPVAEYSHAEGGCSVTGGHVYRGASVPALDGSYVYGDFCSGTLWAITADPQAPGEPRRLFQGDLRISAFGQSPQGEIYLLDYTGGGIHRLVPGSVEGAEAFPRTLSETGCVQAAAPEQTAEGLVPYGVNAPFWSDGADKARHASLPAGHSARLAGESLVLPVGTVLVKEFVLEGELIETRLLVRHRDGGWGGYSYAWLDGEGGRRADAQLVTEETRVPAAGQTWVYPSPVQCLACHTAAAGHTLGLTTPQMNRRQLYPSTGRSANQLHTWNAVGLIAPPTPPPETLPALPDPLDEDVATGQRARAYLHSNCAQCHRPGSAATAGMDLRYATPLAEAGVCRRPPDHGDLGIPEARLLAPGEPERSLLLQRMARRDAFAMPPLASTVADAAGVALIREWIASGTQCP